MSKPLINASANLGDYLNAVSENVAAAEQNGVANRVWQRDATLWKTEPEHIAEISIRLGWLNVATKMRKHVAELKEFGEEIQTRRVQIDCVVRDGRQFALRRNVARCGRRDERIPAAVHPRHDRPGNRPRAGAENQSKENLVHHREQIRRHDRNAFALQIFRRARARAKFHRDHRSWVGVAQTCYRKKVSPRVRKSRRHRRALFRVVVLWACARRADGHRCRQTARPRGSDDARVRGGCARRRKSRRMARRDVLATLAQHGRDKITFMTSKNIATFGAWAEQLIAESTGKEGKGLVPIDGESLPSHRRMEWIGFLSTCNSAKQKNAAVEQCSERVGEDRASASFVCNCATSTTSARNFFDGNLRLQLPARSSASMHSINRTWKRRRRNARAFLTDDRRPTTEKPVWENKAVCGVLHRAGLPAKNLREALGAYFQIGATRRLPCADGIPAKHAGKQRRVKIDARRRAQRVEARDDGRLRSALFAFDRAIAQRRRQ